MNVIKENKKIDSHRMDIFDWGRQAVVASNDEKETAEIEIKVMLIKVGDRI